MAKLQTPWFMTVAPPQFISVSKRPATIILDTIVEEEKDFGVSGSPLSSSPVFISSSLHLPRHMEGLANEFGDSLDRLKNQNVNDHSGVQNKSEQKGFNFKRVVR
uniref:Uncharacterized protein n=1 Tax=Salix viminalis TaxID=40686 RepID=A0A6N2NFS5_SALVM